MKIVCRILIDEKLRNISMQVKMIYLMISSGTYFSSLSLHYFGVSKFHSGSIFGYVLKLMNTLNPFLITS